MSEREYVRKVLLSSTFHSSESLQKLLTYLAEHSFSDPPHPVKEYQIATEVLGRGPQFDPRVDSSVRVNVARLRSKLLEYYSIEGKDDPLRIEIPKGSYVILFHEHAGAPPKDSSAVRAISVEAGGPQLLGAAAQPVRPSFGALTAALAAGLALGALITLWMNPATIIHGGGPSAVLKSFWGEFTGPQDNTIVVFSNARFVGDGENGLRYFDPELHRLEDVRELHTGVGEVAGVYELSLVFQGLGAPLKVKRAALVDWDEVKKSNVIFIGGPAENMPVREFRRGARFVFERITGPDGHRRMVVVARSPEGEPRQFDAGVAKPMRRDYAVIRLLPGLVPGRRMLLLAGISTLGTQAAVEFVSRPDTVQALFAELAPDGSEGIPGFECVLEVSINGGVPVNSRIVAFHEIDAASAALPGAN